MTTGRRAVVVGAALFGLALLAGSLTLGRPLASFDEGFILVGAERVLHGELPYRDFYALYPPGQYYLVASLFGLFGAQVVVLRIYCLVVRALVAWLVYLVTRRIAGRRAAFAAWAGAALWTATFGNFGLTTYPALALVLLTFWLLLTELERVGRSAGLRRSRLVLAGAALGGAALVRHDLGAYGAIAALSILVALVRRTGLRAVAPPFAAALAASFLLPALPILLLAPWREIAFELFLYPARSYAEMRSLPYPPLFVRPPSVEALVSLAGLARAAPGLPFLAPPLVAAVALIAVARLRRRERAALDARGLGDAGLVALALFTLCAANLARVRPDLLHAVPSVVPAFAVAAGLAQRLWPAGGMARAVAVAGGALTLGAVTPAVAALAMSRPAALVAVVRGGADPARAAGLPAEPMIREVAELLRREVPEGERIFVGCGRHDRLFINEPILYFLAGRLPGGPYHALDPGVATTRAAQEEIVRGLERQRVRVVVLSTRNDDRLEPNASAISSGVTLLDDYLASHYARSERVGPWHTLLRRTAAWADDVNAESAVARAPR